MKPNQSWPLLTLVDLPGDENMLNAAALSSSKDSLEKENDTVCETVPLSLEDFQSNSAHNSCFRYKDKVSWCFLNGQTHSKFVWTSCNHVFGICMGMMSDLLIRQDLVSLA